MKASHALVRPLALLDIDGTLLDTRGAGRASFARALRAVFGWTDDLSWLSFAGATDLDVLRRIGERHGRSFAAEETDLFFERLASELDALLQTAPPAVFPGVRELLTAFGGIPGSILGLVTGNTEACARIKLRHAGLHGHFVLGAFGHEHGDRVEIARLAFRRAERHARGGRLEPVVLIGDTPADIAAARAIGARAVAVATGAYGVAALRAAGADLVVETLGDPAIWRILGVRPDAG